MVSFMTSSQQLLQEKVNTFKLAFFDKNITRLESDGVTKLSLD